MWGHLLCLTLSDPVTHVEDEKELLIAFTGTGSALRVIKMWT